MRRLYHATLIRNLEQIRKQGLVPKPGAVTEAYYENAAEFVCAADENHKGRLPKIIIQQMVNSGLVEWSANYSIESFMTCQIARKALKLETGIVLIRCLLKPL